MLTHAARAAAEQPPLVAARGAREGLWLEQTCLMCDNFGRCCLATPARSQGQIPFCIFLPNHVLTHAARAKGSGQNNLRFAERPAPRAKNRGRIHLSYYQVTQTSQTRALRARSLPGCAAPLNNLRPGVPRQARSERKHLYCNEITKCLHACEGLWSYTVDAFKQIVIY